MIAKKNPKIDLNKKRTMFFQIGIITSLSIVFAAFQIGVEHKTGYSFDSEGAIPIESIIIPVTRQELPKPEAPKLKAAVDLKIVINSTPDVKDVPMATTEAFLDTKVIIIPMLNEAPDAEEILDVFQLEELPEFMGGEKELLRFLGKETKYPQIAVENGIQGRVYIGFVINKKGEITNVTVLRGTDPLLDKEALRVVKSMPKWKPGKQCGKAVNVHYNVPINFRLN
ncbi:MAG: energy transducer TonB [Salinivirgaceae bacterium]|nr:energy transducer TonB [Salinivirgaceae bacterium]